ncbi:MAG: hypothetical protein Q4F97_03385 [Bacteroidales bacterium]|nr:hypothetical protein [Bacteroidales bacterium]
MNKQIQKIDETIAWLEANAPEDACVILMAIADVNKTDEKTSDGLKKVELKTYIDGYDQDLSEMLIKKMVDIPLLKQVFSEALAAAGRKIDFTDYDKWKDKNKYDLKFEPLDLDAFKCETLEGEPAEYIKVIQDFCIWMNAKPSRNLNLLVLASDELNSEKTTFAMGFAPDLVVMLTKEFESNYGFINIAESAFYALDRNASYEEYLAYRDSLKK